MEVAKKTVDLWNQLNTRNDTEEIVRLHAGMHGEDVHPETIRRALRLGKATEQVFETVNAFYKKKLAKLKKIA